MTTKFRLNRHARNTLREFANDTLVCAEEAEKEEAAFKALQWTVNALFDWYLPDANREVLRRYNLLISREYLTLSLRPGATGGRTVNVWFGPRDARVKKFDASEYQRSYGPRVLREWPRNTNQLYPNDMPRAIAEDLAVRFAAYEAAAAAHDEARSKVLAAVDQAIKMSPTLEELALIWPEAEQLREKLAGKLLPAAIDTAAVVRTLSTATFAGPPSGEGGAT